MIKITSVVTTAMLDSISAMLANSDSLSFTIFLEST
jgi:hypothetical protein